MHLLGKVLDGALAQSKLASVFDKNGKGVRWPPLAIEGMANEPPLHFVSKCMLLKIGL